MVTSVAVQQSQRLFREGLGQLVDAEHDMQVVAAVRTGSELLAICTVKVPDVALIEVDSVEWDGGKLSRSLRRAGPKLRIIGLTAGEPTAATVVKARRCGIRHVLPRSAGIGQILAALRDPQPLSRIPASAGPAQQGSSGDSTSTALTSRELTVLNLVGAGFTSRQISAELAISHKTVENHKQRIFGKLGVQNQAHAVSVALRRGLMRPERVIGLSLAE